MPMPQEYSNASQNFEAFLADAKKELDLASRHMTYTTVQAVLVVFRRRLTLPQAIAFAAVLPTVVRAIFVDEWDTSEERRPFADLATMNEEVKHFRRHHNFSPDNAIQVVAGVLSRHVDKDALRSVLEGISPQASAYWLAD